MPSKEDITRLLQDLSAGSRGAEEVLFPLVYDELWALAKGYMSRERPEHTLQTTALVHEAYLRLGGMTETAWESRAHYLRVASKAMRRVLIDHARRKRSEKLGGDRRKEPLDNAAVFIGDPSLDLLALEDVLRKLAEVEPRMESLVELRFFGGLTVEETARILGISDRTVRNDWRIAKAWLKREME